jgi:hypothetical protein
VFPTVQRFLSTPQLIIPKTSLQLAGLNISTAGVELGLGLKILLCSRFNRGLKLLMRKNEGFFLLLGINAKNL